MSEKLKVSFICVHNSCRSQIAEGKSFSQAPDVFEGYSTGTETIPQINQDAVIVSFSFRKGRPFLFRPAQTDIHLSLTIFNTSFHYLKR